MPAIFIKQLMCLRRFFAHPRLRAHPWILAFIAHRSPWQRGATSAPARFRPPPKESRSRMPWRPAFYRLSITMIMRSTFNQSSSLMNHCNLNDSSTCTRLARFAGLCKSPPPEFIPPRGRYQVGNEGAAHARVDGLSSDPGHRRYGEVCRWGSLEFAYLCRVFQGRRAGE